MVLEVLFFHVLLHVCNSGIYDFWRIVCCGFAFKYVFLSASPFLSWQYLIHVTFSSYRIVEILTLGTITNIRDAV